MNQYGEGVYVLKLGVLCPRPVLCIYGIHEYGVEAGIEGEEETFTEYWLCAGHFSRTFHPFDPQSNPLGTVNKIPTLVGQQNQDLGDGGVELSPFYR